MATLQCRIVEEVHESHYEWKRIQMSEQQSQRERKNIIQKALVFTRRAKEILAQEMVQVFVLSIEETRFKLKV